MEYVLLPVSFAIVLSGALLFTNAIEWIGHRLELGEGAVGSILAAVGTATPETLIAIVALLGAEQGSEDVAIGAIVGAPFLLATLAMGLVGLFAYAYRQRRAQGVSLEAHGPTLERDLIFFLAFFTLAGLLAWGPPAALRIPLGVCFLARLRLLRRPHPARRRRRCRERRPSTRSSSTAARSGAATRLSASASSSSWSGWRRWSAAPTSSSRSCSASPKTSASTPLVLALILAPLATELPEKVNSFFWVREGKDALALGNITGAMVFQSTIPVGIGLLFTDWALDGNAILSIALGVAGGLLAYLSLHRARRLPPAGRDRLVRSLLGFPRRRRAQRLSALDRPLDRPAGGRDDAAVGRARDRRSVGPAVPRSS